MLLRNLGVLLGPELEFVPGMRVRIAGGRFGNIGRSLRPGAGEETLDCEGLLLVPGLVNAHTHIGDSIAKDATLDGTPDQKIHPVFGAKRKILGRTSPAHLASFMRNACQSMLNGGTTTFVDFREGGTGGLALLRRAVSGVPIRPVVLGRLEFYQGARQIRANEPLPEGERGELAGLLGQCDGLGVSGANENSDSVLQSYSRHGGLRAIHCSETRQSVAASIKNTGRSETARALHVRPHFMIHMTHASGNDLRLASRKTGGIVVCPRANAALAEGIPDVELMRKAGCNVAIGTDNVMVNPPDMFREMDYLWKATMAMHKKRIDPKHILQMATVNAGRILRMDIGIIDKKKLADCMFIDKHSIDLEPMHSPHASIVHRASGSSIRAVMAGGHIVHGRI